MFNLGSIKVLEARFRDMKNLGIVFVIILLPILLVGQQSDYLIFKQAIDNLQKKTVAQKEAVIEKAQSSSDQLNTMSDEGQVIVMGGSPEQNKQLEEAVMEALSEVTNSEKSNSSKSNKPKEENIQFRTTPMFPDEVKGKEFIYKERPETEKIEWVTTDVITTTEVIEIDDIPDPEKRQQYKDIATHQTNIAKANEIGFIEAIQRECNSKTQYDQLMRDLKEQGFDFAPYFKQASILDSDQEKVSFIQSKIEAVVQKVIYQ